MKTRNLLIAIVATGFLFFTSCEEEIAKPEINRMELGYEDTGIAYAGSDFHMEFEIFAEGRIESIRVDIHPEGDHDHSKKDADDEHGEWEVDITFTEKYQGLKNTEFHEHIDVPADAEAGSYHFYLYVNDQEGNQTKYESEIEVDYN